MRSRPRACRAAVPRSAGARSRQQSRQQARAAWGALLIALGLLFAQGPMLLHLLLVQHATCEHGELVELVRPREGPAAPARAVTRDNGPAPDRLDAAEAGGSDHAHCDVLALRHRPGDLAPAVGAPSLLSIEPGASLCARGETRPVPLLSLAPKSSPPAA